MAEFKIVHENGDARIGKLKTPHGWIETPFFMPVVTRATGKFITAHDYIDLGKGVRAKAAIANSLILSLRPGVETIRAAGGIHEFMNFDGIVFTDCGGFQSSSNFFDLKSKRGIHFRSPYDGKKVIVTPKGIMDIQLGIGSDVAMMLDDMSPYGSSFEEAKKAMENTHRWGKESLHWHEELKKEHQSKQLLFGISQGNFYKELREESAKFISSLDFDGIAIGGVAIGEPMKDMYHAVDSAIKHIPVEKPRYVMGVGSPDDIRNLILRGVDCFDSVFPTQNARHNTILTKRGRIYIDRGVYAKDFNPIEDDCRCLTCQNYTKAYLHHLSKIREPILKHLASIHNQFYMQELIDTIKTEIKEK